MNNEIKEILDSLKFVIDNPTLEDEVGDKQVTIINYTELNAEESKQLLDYITNSQEENKDYKSRCEKAIPMLKELNIKLKDILKIGIDIKEISDIETILYGGDEVVEMSV